MYKIVVSFLAIMISASLFSNECIVDAPKEITPDWERKVLGIRQDVTDVVGSIEELVSGIAPAFREEFCNKLREAIKKQPTGEYIEYWPNGKLKARIGYREGKAHGHVHGWYEDGKDAFKGYFDKGVKQGIHMNFFPENGKRISNAANVFFFNEKGRLDGDQRMHHSIAGLSVAVEYKNGLVDGCLECWDINEKRYVAAIYKKNLLQKGIAPEAGKIIPHGFEDYVADVMNRFIDEAEEEFNIRATMSGGNMVRDIEEIKVFFTKYKRGGTIEEARELLVKLNNKFAAIINAHEKIRPYLREYPFPAERAKVCLSFDSPDGKRYTDGSVTFATLGKGNIVYYDTEDPNDPYRSMDLYQEPYETAVKIVKENTK